MPEEVGPVPESKDNSLTQPPPSTTLKVKSGEVRQKPKRKQEYTDIINWLLQHPTPTAKK